LVSLIIALSICGMWNGRFVSAIAHFKIWQVELDSFVVRVCRRNECNQGFCIFDMTTPHAVSKLQATSTCLTLLSLLNECRCNFATDKRHKHRRI
jgi:hypothetical protein